MSKCKVASQCQNRKEQCKNRKATSQSQKRKAASQCQKRMAASQSQKRFCRGPPLTSPKFTCESAKQHVPIDRWNWIKELFIFFPNFFSETEGKGRKLASLIKSLFDLSEKKFSGPCNDAQAV
jgi:hypothetical protein